jgi:hypothetical protein
MIKNRRPSFDSMQNEPMVKDLDRPSSEMHSANILRNSFILEEDEPNNLSQKHSVNEPIFENDKEDSNAFINNLPKQEDTGFDLPFPELIYINLADNKVK